MTASTCLEARGLGGLHTYLPYRTIIVVGDRRLAIGDRRSLLVACCSSLLARLLVCLSARCSFALSAHARRSEEVGGLAALEKRLQIPALRDSETPRLRDSELPDDGRRTATSDGRPGSATGNRRSATGGL